MTEIAVRRLNVPRFRLAGSAGTNRELGLPLADKPLSRPRRIGTQTLALSPRRRGRTGVTIALRHFLTLEVCLKPDAQG